MCLVDMGFNLGIPRLMKFKNMGSYRKTDFEWASAEMLNSRWAKQVGRRADNLAKAMENGDWGLRNDAKLANVTTATAKNVMRLPPQ